MLQSSIEFRRSFLPWGWNHEISLSDQIEEGRLPLIGISVLNNIQSVIPILANSVVINISGGEQFSAADRMCEQILQIDGRFPAETSNHEMKQGSPTWSKFSWNFYSTFLDASTAGIRYRVLETRPDGIPAFIEVSNLLTLFPIYIDQIKIGISFYFNTTFGTFLGGSQDTFAELRFVCSPNSWEINTIFFRARDKRKPAFTNEVASVFLNSLITALTGRSFNDIYQSLLTNEED